MKLFYYSKNDLLYQEIPSWKVLVVLLSILLVIPYSILKSTSIKENTNLKHVLICIRDGKPNEKNPFTATEVKENIMKHYSSEVESGKVVVTVIPDICSIEFGRGVGYDIIEHIPPSEIGDISATKIRKEMGL